MINLHNYNIVCGRCDKSIVIFSTITEFVLTVNCPYCRDEIKNLEKIKEKYEKGKKKLQDSQGRE